MVFARKESYAAFGFQAAYVPIKLAVISDFIFASPLNRLWTVFSRATFKCACKIIKLFRI
jgi:hypothetical protein